ncbi:HD domain-containing phosphohydrolase [Jiangella asiatica]|uniref:HD domain-containing protein n=1 Tax=Jiangella asiatica TaxID=2530372 RepID=A0A4R5CMW5_9ACTN|nr:HD domain-containing phosphohydrolase [Jiangella asiatica]TDE00590.1 HD domain-containing protein [Jiangella asiatica]
MTENEPSVDDRCRAAEVIAAMCLATDLGMAFPFEHGLHATLITMRLTDLLDVDAETASHTYYLSLLMYAGCTTDVEEHSRIFVGGATANLMPVQFGSRTQSLGGVVRAVSSPDGPPLRRAYEVATRLPMAARFLRPHFAAICEVAEMMAERLGMPPAVQGMFFRLTERWDGNGVLGRGTGDDLPLPLRIVHVARDAANQQLIGGTERTAAVIRERAGHAFDPDVANTFADHAEQILAESESESETAASVWEATLAAEPKPRQALSGPAIDGALAAMGDFADLVSPSLTGHTSGVARLAADAAELMGFDAANVGRIRRAALVHDVGRVAVHPRIWLKPGPLTADEWEQVRLHPYHTGRVFSRSRFLHDIASVACAHHERLDGSGYSQGATAASLSPQARLLAVADAFHAKTEPRPYRQPHSAAEAAEILERDAKQGKLDPGCVAAVIEAAGQRVRHLERPAGLTEREVLVIGLIGRGLQTKQVARRLGISAKTADHHIQNVYRKIGVSTRAGATLYAMQHGLMSWGEFPISR